jgi:hypothetical protein
MIVIHIVNDNANKAICQVGQQFCNPDAESQITKNLQRIAHNGGMTEEDLIREAERYNPDDLPLWIEGLNQQITDLKTAFDYLF